MKKIKTMFERDWNGNREVINEITPGIENFHNINNVAITKKWDGKACLILNNQLYKRYDAKDKEPPKDFIECEFFDGKHHIGWVKCSKKDPNDKYHYEAFNRDPQLIINDLNFTKGFKHGIIEVRNNKTIWLNGTYELIGEKINGNPEKVNGHYLIYHGVDIINLIGLEYDYLKNWFIGKDIEGFVLYDCNMNMAKIKKKDFGLKRTD